MAKKKTSKRGGKRPGAGRTATLLEPITVAVAIPAAMLDRLDRQAESQGVSRSELIRRAIGYWQHLAG